MSPSVEGGSIVNQASPITLAVVTGGHPFDVPNFHRLFRSLDGVEACIQHMDDFATSSREVRQSYDAVLFYTMLRDTPPETGLPWTAGNPKQAIEDLGQTKQGIVILHHAILGYPNWPLWTGMVGIEDRTFGYHMGEHLSIEIADANHPITRGMQPWQMIDETYSMADAGPGSHVLLTCHHPRSMRTIAWTRQHRASRVFCLQSGHDNQTWTNPSFRELLRRGIAWSAG
jgi:type 1 glutamine amidotransferase